MSLFGSLMRDFGDDPFFSMHNDQMRLAERMMAGPPMGGMFGGMFGGFGFPQLMPALEQHMGAPGHQSQRGGGGGIGGRQLAGFGLGRGGFPDVGAMFSGMERMGNDPNCTTFSSTSMVSYTMGSDGQPKVYQASSSTATAPGGVKETRRAMSDSTTGVRKLAIGHHLGERAHIVEKSRNRVTGEEDDAEEFVNIADGEEETFNEEWSQRMSHAKRKPQSRPAVLHRSNAGNQPLAITAGPSNDLQRRGHKRNKDGSQRDAADVQHAVPRNTGMDGAGNSQMRRGSKSKPDTKKSKKTDN